MEGRTLLDGLQTPMIVFVFGVCIFGFIRAYRAWRNPRNSWGLGISWYFAPLRWRTPAEHKHEVDEVARDPALVRAVALTGMLGAGAAILGGIAILIWG